MGRLGVMQLNCTGDKKVWWNTDKYKTDFLHSNWLFFFSMDAKVFIKSAQFS